MPGRDGEDCQVEAAAHAAGIPCVGVGSHHYTAEQLRAAGADYVIESLVDGLPPL